MTIRLIDPRGEPNAPDPNRPAPRLGRIPDRIDIGFLINEVSRQTGPDFTRYSMIVEDVLRTRHRDVTVFRDAKPVLSRPADGTMLQRYLQCRGVITGLAK